jgi:hypothetical protein
VIVFLSLDRLGLLLALVCGLTGTVAGIACALAVLAVLAARSVWTAGQPTGGAPRRRTTSVASAVSVEADSAVSASNRA